MNDIDNQNEATPVSEEISNTQGPADSGVAETPETEQADTEKTDTKTPKYASRGFTPQIREFYDEEIAPRRESSPIGYHQDFLDGLAKPLLERMDTIPGDSIEYLGFSITVPKVSRPARLDAFYWDETSQIFYAYIEVLNDTADAVTPLDSSQFKQAVSAFNHFIQNVDFIAVNGDRSSPGVAVARSLSQREMQPVEYRLTIVSDMLAGTRLIDVPNWNIDKATCVARRCCLGDLIELSSIDDKAIEIDFLQTRFQKYPIQLIEAGTCDRCTSYLCAFPGIVLAQLYQEYAARLLEGNVRVFLGLTKKINRSMKETILTEPNLVFAFNNGLSVTATNLETEERDGACYLKKLTGMKIVNGGQTTATLAATYALSSDHSAIKKVFVPMKINIVSAKEEQTLVPLISKYANSQNAVSKSAFESNSPFQIQMERIVSGMQCNKHIHWTYERLEGAYKQEASRHKSAAWKREHPKNAVIVKEDFAKYMAILQGVPHIAARGKQKCFMDTLKLYNLTNDVLKDNDTWAPVASRYSQAFVLRVMSVAIFCRKIVDECKVRGKQCAMATSLYTAALLFRLIEQDGSGVFPYEYIWTKQEVAPALLDYSIEIALKIVDYLTGTVHINKKGKEVTIPTEWAKQQECWEEITKWPISLPDKVASCLMLNDAWSKYEKVAVASFKADQTKVWQDALRSLGLNGWNLLLDYIQLYPTGIKEDDVFAFKDILAKVNRYKSFEKVTNKQFEVVRSIHDQIRAHDATLLEPLV